MSDLARLLQQYGYGEQPNALAQDAPAVDTSNVLAGMPQRKNALADALRVAGVPQKDEHGFLFSNVGGELRFNPYEAIKNFMAYRAPPGALSTSGDDAPVRNSAEAAGWLGLSGLGLNFAGQTPKNALGIFGGRLAKTADHAALAKAEELAAKGADRKEIWDQTGWFQGADGKWRFEIDDSVSKWLAPGPNEILPGNQIRGPMGIMVEHQGMSANYPDVLERQVQYFKPREISSPMPAGVYSPTKDTFAIRAFDPSVGGEPHKTALHEIQHAVQQREGFALGTNPTHEAAKARSENSIIQQMRTEFARRVFEEPGFRGSKEAIDEWERILRLERSDKQVIGEQRYYDNPGEREARNVESRMRMTPEQRRARPPWETE